MLATQIVRLVTFGAALLIALIIARLSLHRYREGAPDESTTKSPTLALVSYGLLIAYVAVLQPGTGGDFSSPITWKTAIGQAGLLLGAFVGVRDYVVFHPFHSSHEEPK